MEFPLQELRMGRTTWQLGDENVESNLKSVTSPASSLISARREIIDQPSSKWRNPEPGKEAGG